MNRKQKPDLHGEPLDFEDEEFIDDKKEDEMYNSIT
ncbi:hypothetical protein L1Y74_18555, partial [Acinetobacter baumannii]|nr:hypothetical protein [Acinetobacter baumannii]